MDELQIETVVIKASPEAIAWGKKWRVWRIYNHTNCWKRWGEWLRYYGWWWKTLLTERKVPWVILEIMETQVQVLNIPDMKVE